MRPLDPVSRSKNQAALIKRTSSSIATILQDNDMSDGDRRLLKDAERILRDLGSQAGRRAKQIKVNEERLAKLESDAARQASESLAGWFLDDTEGKVAIVLTSNGRSYGRQCLVKDLKGYVTFANVKVEPALKDLVNRVVAAKNSIVSHVAYNAVRAKEPVSVTEQMAKYKQIFDLLKSGHDVKDLTALWNVALVREQLEKANQRESDAAKAY